MVISDIYTNAVLHAITAGCIFVALLKGVNRKLRWLSLFFASIFEPAIFKSANIDLFTTKKILVETFPGSSAVLGNAELRKQD